MLTFVGRHFEKKVLESHLDGGVPEKCYLLYGPPGVGKQFVALDLAKSFGSEGSDILYRDSVTVQTLPDLVNQINLPVSGMFRFVLVRISSCSVEALARLLDAVETSSSSSRFILMSSSYSHVQKLSGRFFTLELPVLSKDEFVQLFGEDGGKAWKFCGGLPGNYAHWKAGKYHEWVPRIKAFFKEPRKNNTKATLEFSRFMEENFREKLIIWCTVLFELDHPNKEFMLEKTSQILSFWFSDPAVAANYLVKETRIALIN